MEFMSSEESDSDNVIEVQPIPWRSDRVTSFLHALDRKANEKRSPQAKRQMKERRLGSSSSSRVRPGHDSEGCPLPSWLFAMCNST